MRSWMEKVKIRKKSHKRKCTLVDKKRNNEEYGINIECRKYVNNSTKIKQCKSEMQVKLKKSC